MWYRFSSSELRFTNEVTDSYSGQTNSTLRAVTPDGEDAGYIQYVEYMGEPSISMIEVPDNMRRKGYGKALVHELQSMYPDQEISWGGMTPDGSALRDSLPFEDVPTKYNKAFAYYENAKKELEHLQAIADNFYETDNHTPEERTQFNIDMDRWNQLHDQIWKLEQTLDDRKPSNRIIKRNESNVV